jgi:hypothetical protein
MCRVLNLTIVSSNLSRWVQIRRKQLSWIGIGAFGGRAVLVSSDSVSFLCLHRGTQSDRTCNLLVINIQHEGNEKDNFQNENT